MDLRYYRIAAVETLLRLFPFPCPTGLVRIGNPDRESPVLLTGNFRLTVERVKRALRGLDVWLLVANSRGVNVWCAATGGHLTNHDVVSAVKTSGVEERVNHRRLVLPQLAATGIEGRLVHRQTGWRVVWGPVYAKDVPEFLGRGFEKTREMRTVRFPLPARLEMAVAWAFPISLLALVVWPFWPEGAAPLAGFVWAAALVLFTALPLYESRLRVRDGHSRGFVFFDFGRLGLPLLVWLLLVAAVGAWSLFGGGISPPVALRWGIASLVVLLVLTMDLAGSTPTLKSRIHPESEMRIVLDEELCRGVADCEATCPVDVFTVDRERRLAVLQKAELCVQCGACIVQCPFDALHFETPGGEVIPPDVVRRFKLNLLGTRRTSAGPNPPQPSGVV